MSKSREWSIYVLGLFMLTSGSALTIISNMGAGPFDALLVGLFRTFGLSVGTWEILVGSVLVLLNTLGKNKKIEYFALLTSFITGVFIDIWLIIFSKMVHIISLLEQFFWFSFGMIAVSCGIAIYLQTNIAPNPFDRFMQVVSEYTGLNTSYSRALISLVCIALAYFMHGPLSIGTLLSALFTGMLIQYFCVFLQIKRV